MTECTFDNLNNLNWHSFNQILRNLFHNHSQNWSFFQDFDFSLQYLNYLLSKKSPLTYTENSTWLTFSAVLLSLFSTNSSSPISREVVEKIYSTVESLESYMQRKLFPKIQTSSFPKTFSCQIQNKTKRILSFLSFSSIISKMVQTWYEWP